MTFEELLTDVRRITEDDGLRWNDKVIGQYTRRAVNHFYKKTKDSLKEFSFTLGVGLNVEVLDSTYQDCEILSIRYQPSIGDSYFLQEISVSDIPKDPSASNGSPKFYATSHSYTGIGLDTAPAGETLDRDMRVITYPPSNDGSGSYQVQFVDQWDFSSDETATSGPGGQLETVIPIKQKYDMDLVNFVSGSLLLEMNDQAYVEKGKFYLESVEQKLEADLKQASVRKAVSQRSSDTYLFSNLLSDVRRIVENQVEIDAKGVSNMKDFGRRWDDRAIAHYAREGVNHIYRKTGSVSDQVAINMIQSQDIYTVPTQGRIIKIEVLPENNNQAIVLQQVQFSEIPTVQLSENEKDPEYFALTQTVSGSTMQNTQDLIVYPTPGRTATGALVVTYAMEWDFYADPTATADQLDTEIPILPRFELDLTHYVAGNLLLEMGSPTLAQKGQFYLNKSEEQIGHVATVNSLSFWNNQPTRFFP